MGSYRIQQRQKWLDPKAARPKSLWSRLKNCPRYWGILPLEHFKDSLVATVRVATSSIRIVIDEKDTVFKPSLL